MRTTDFWQALVELLPGTCDQRKDRWKEKKYKTPLRVRGQVAAIDWADLQVLMAQPNGDTEVHRDTQKHTETHSVTQRYTVSHRDTQ